MSWFGAGRPGMGSAVRRARVRIMRAIPVALAGILLAAAGARASELATAELEGTANQITVEQGQTVAFRITVWASGDIRCSATPSNPATARVDTSFSISETGVLTSNAASAPLAFYGVGSAPCAVSWPGDPVRQSVDAIVSAHRDAPLGTRSIRLRTATTTPSGTGVLLRDDSPTLLTFTVVPGTDRTPPSVVCDGPAGEQGDGDWWLSDVWYDCTAADAGSGLADPGDAAFSLVTDGEGAERWTNARTVWDRMGNESAAGPFGSYMVDLQDPVVTIEAPGSGAEYFLGAAAAADYDCADSTSGIASCDGSVVDGGTLDTSTVGEHSLEVTATDHAGRVRTLTRTYRVVYRFEEPSQPGGDNREEFGAGATIPVQWSLDGVADPDSFVRAASAPCGSAYADAEPADTVGRGFAYDPANDRYTLQWKTRKAWAGSCRTLFIELDDGMVHAAEFSFR